MAKHILISVKIILHCLSSAMGLYIVKLKHSHRYMPSPYSLLWFHFLSLSLHVSGFFYIVQSNCILIRAPRMATINQRLGLV